MLLLYEKTSIKLTSTRHDLLSDILESTFPRKGILYLMVQGLILERDGVCHMFVVECQVELLHMCTDQKSQGE